MKFFHLSDLHIGKQLHHYNMIAEQRDILGKIVALAEREKPDAVLIAGDIYDTPVPSAEAVSVFDEFLTALNDLEPEVTVCIIAGNHDSAKRIDFASDILAKHRVMIAGMPPVTREETIRKVSFFDAYGEVCIYLLPFVKPSYVRNLIDSDITTYDEAVRLVIERENIDTAKRNILVSHQFYIAAGREPETSDSEIRMVGGIENVDTAVLEPFDYAALGHIHRKQKIGRVQNRYCGTPLQYSVSEAGDEKTVTMVELLEKGSEPQIRRLPILCHPDVKRVRGTLEELKLLSDTMEKMPDGSGRADAYVSVVLTDEKEMYDFRERLEELFAHILEIRVDNERTRKRLEEEPEEKGAVTPFQAFASFYEAVRHCPMTEEQETILARMVEEAEEEERV